MEKVGEDENEKRKKTAFFGPPTESAEQTRQV